MNTSNFTSGTAPKKLGRAGESYAVRYLESLGWKILERNWRCRDGEIDIIAQDGTNVVFCEVKTRSHVRAGHPLEHVDYFKLKTLQKLAVRWLSNQPQWIPEFRIDVIGVVLNRGKPEISHVRGAQ